jgi:hypothetical protein
LKKPDQGRYSDFEARNIRHVAGEKYVFVPGGGCERCAFQLGGKLEDKCDSAICLDMLDGHYVKEYGDGSRPE